MIRIGKIRGLTAAVVLVGSVALLAAGCDTVDQLMEVKNPEQLRDQDLSDAKLVNVLVNSAQGDFQAAYDDPFIWVGEMLTDEWITGVNWEDYKRANNRHLIYFEGPPDAMFGELQGARYTAELSYEKLSAIEGGVVTGDQLARVLAYAGYSYILLGDAMCESTIDQGEEIYTPAELYGFAIERLTEALSQAGDANLRKWINTGLARAHLNRMEYSQAMTFANAVADDSFAWWVEYVDDPRADNSLYGDVTGANHNIGVHPRFLNGGWDYWLQEVPDALQTDPRIQHESMWSRGHDAISELYKPYQSWSYSGFTGNTIAEGAVQDDDGGVPLFRRGTSIKLASGLEARHMYYEAGLWSGSVPEAEVLAFVNQRRAFGNQDPVTSSGVALRNELREQRARDLFLGGFRLGDLRRYLAQGSPPPEHSFPTGPHPVADRGSYLDATCFPMPLSEYQGNPNIADPNR